METVDNTAVDKWVLIHFFVAFVLCFFFHPGIVLFLVVGYELLEYLLIGELFFFWNISGRYEIWQNVAFDIVAGWLAVFLYMMLF